MGHQEIEAGSVSAKDKDARQWAMFLHLSLLAGCLVPLAGLVAPIVIWQVKKDEYPVLDDHGKNALNWILSYLLYGFICVLLVFLFVGVFLLIALWVVSIIFPIIAALKANDGVLWKYPMSIRFM